MSGCPVLAPNEYKNQHWRICKSYKIETCEHWHEHKPQPVVEGDNVTLLWDFPIRTDRTMQANQPDIIAKDFKEKTCHLIDMSIPADQNIPVKEFDKLSKYKDLDIEIQRMWKLRTNTVPIIVGNFGMIKKGCQKHLDTIPCEPQLQET